MSYEINEFLHSEMDQKPEVLTSLNVSNMREFDIAVMEWIKKNASNFCVY
ncbi:MAG: hypothetical protein Q4F84_04705 [Fibrobacter sp.]|nr:hypothetical protein [Fibrobacter sp.]